MKLKSFKYFVFLFFTTAWLSIAFAGIHIFSDTEGSTAKIDALVNEGKIKWVNTPNGKMLDFVNSKDAVVFLGDLSGPNWLDPKNPQNIMIRNALLDLKNRYPKRVDIVLGNHEFNRLGFVRDNVRINQGKHPQFSKWLAEKGLKDSTLNRVMFWGTNAYGVNKEGIPQPLEQYQQELSNTKGTKVSIEEAAEQFAKDLKVGKGSEPHGKMLQYILVGQESAVRNGYAFTHASVNVDSLGIVPLQEKKISGGATWLIERNEKFYKPQINQFISDVKQDKIPAAILAEIGDARWDSVGKRVVHDSNSLTYTERPRDGDQYRGVEQKVAKSFAEDTKQPLKGIFTGHKPAGDFATAHRLEINGNAFFDIVVDTSRGPNGMHATTTLLDNGDVEMRGQTAEGKMERWIVGQNGDKLVGRINEDGFHIKGVTSDGRYILERYQGFNLEQKIVSKASIDPKKTFLSSIDSADENSLKAKVASLKDAIKSSGGSVLADIDEASRLVGDKFILDLRGASSWAAVDDVKAEKIKLELIKLSKSLDPKKVVIMTGGNRASHLNAVENIVHDVFAGPDVKEKFDIIGFMKHDTPADEVDKAVKYVVLMGNGDNWDGPVQAAQKFVSERRGASVIIGGGGVLKRAIDSEVAATMKDRLFLFQGYGGASEEKAPRGTAINSMDELIAGVEKLDKEAIIATNVGNKKLRIGIYTGSFDPPHNGHKSIVEEMKKKFNLDIVYVVPDSNTAYKPGMQPLEKRKKMVGIMFKDDPSIRVLTSEMELATGKGEMWDVVKAIKNEHPGSNLFNIMGTDTFEWYSKLPAESREKNVTILVNKRAGQSTNFPKKLGDNAVVSVDLKDEGFSSTGIRNDIKAGVESQALPKEVRTYIAENKLYANSTVTKNTLIEKSEKTNPKKLQFVKDSPTLAYRITSDRFEDIPNEIRKHLGEVDKTKYTSEYLKKNIGSVFALQMNGDTPDFYVIGKETFDAKYASVALDDVAKKNGKYLGKLTTQIPDLIAKKDTGLIAVLKTVPTEMIRMSDLGYPLDKEVVIESPWGEQTKPAGKDAFLVWDDGKKQYYMVNVGEDGNPLSYVAKNTSPEGAKKLTFVKEGKGPLTVVAKPEEIQSYFKAQNKQVITLIGYSGAEYQDKDKMIAKVKELLSKADPKKTIINIGATSEGIGEAYKVAKEMGFETTGIVSAQAKKYGGLSPFVDHAFYVEDAAWGGFEPGTQKLTPTSQAMIGVSDKVIGIGGNDVGRDELIAAQKLSKDVTFIPADMNHDIATQKAIAKGLAAPKEFSGSAYDAIVNSKAKNVKVEPLMHAEGHQGEEKILAVGLSGAVIRTTHKDLKTTEIKLNPVKENFVKDSPFLAYLVKSDRIEDVPEEIRKVLLASGKAKEVQAYLRENVESAIALQINNGKADFYIIGKEVFDSKYTAVSLDDVRQKNQAYLDDINKKIPSTLKKGNANLIAILKTTPTEMVKMSDLGFPISKTVVIEAPWGSQVKPAGSDAYVTWDSTKKRYYMVVAGLDGNPLNYVHESTLATRMASISNSVSAPLGIQNEIGEFKKLPENINLKCVEAALLNAAK
jgi:nicotinate (nicotinamide) nucleotide adenylyltransferase